MDAEDAKVLLFLRKLEDFSSPTLVRTYEVARRAKDGHSYLTTVTIYDLGSEADRDSRFMAVARNQGRGLAAISSRTSRPPLRRFGGGSWISRSGAGRRPSSRPQPKSGNRCALAGPERRREG